VGNARQNNGRYTARILHQLSEAGYPGDTHHFARDHSAYIEENVHLWHQVGVERARRRSKDGVEWFSDWERFEDVELFSVAVLVECCLITADARQETSWMLQRASEHARKGLQALPHDHTALATAANLAQARLRLADYDGFRDVLATYEPYFADPNQDAWWLGPSAAAALPWVQHFAEFLALDDERKRKARAEELATTTRDGPAWVRTVWRRVCAPHATLLTRAAV